MTITEELQAVASQLLASNQIQVVIGYEVGPRGRTRPAFVRSTEDVDRLVWNDACTHNLTTYLHDQFKPVRGKKPPRVAIIVKPCDSRAINMLLAEHQFTRDQVHVIGVTCEGIRENGDLQERCLRCTEREPVVSDTLIGVPPEIVPVDLPDGEYARLEGLSPAERMEFWLSQFDRCIRCYACRQVCPMCSCPTCLFERDDNLWVGPGSSVDEKRVFHLGRAYHLAGRCVGCNECERVCPVDIPIGMLNRRLAEEMEKAFGYRAGIEPMPSPITTPLGREE